MSKTVEKNPTLARFILLDGARHGFEQLGRERTFRVHKDGEIPAALRRASSDSIWIATQGRWAEPLLEAASAHFLRRQQRLVLGDLVMLEPPRQELIPSLHTQFRRVVGEVPSFKMLPAEQLVEVLSSPDRADLFIGGIVDEGSGTLALARGDLLLVTVPLAMFPVAGPSRPNFRAFAVDDYGYAIRFGDYEASAHSVLYRIDPEYRRRANKRRAAEEKGFGPSLRRLRVLRRLSRADFPGISSKTIARIERKETGKPRGRTLTALARVLAVEPEEIETF